jgi:RHS repeat-associated protein
VTYTQNYDAENRLISVNVSGQPLPTLFIYDGDGNLVKKIKPDNSKTLYVGGIYEVDKNAGGTVTGTKTYYPAAGAMRVGSTLYYMLKDHLGSASVVTNASSTIVGEDRFYPFGETRFTTGTMFTDKLFTGQRQIAELGIYLYGARFYSPKLGRFLSADTIVPGYANPQNLNRYSYGLNNPSRYTDPTGHRPCEEYQGSCLSENQVTKIHKANIQKIKDKSANKNRANKNADLANVFSDIAYYADVVGAGLSLLETVPLIVTSPLLVGCLEPTLCPEILGLLWTVDSTVSGIGPLATFENLAGLVSLGSTITADAFSGNFYAEDGHVYVGKDSVVSARNFAIGLVPESILDAAVSVQQLKYDEARRNGTEPGGSVELTNFSEIMLQIFWNDIFYHPH